MKLYFLLCFFGMQLYSQNNLIVKKKGLLMLINYDTNNNLVLDTIMHSNIAGYNWVKDTLLVSIHNQGITSIRKYKIIDSVYNKLDNRPFFKISNFKSLYFYNTRNTKTLYTYHDIKLIIDNGLQLSCLIKDIEIWKKSINIYMFKGIGMSGYGFQNPILSTDLNRILIGYINPSLIKKNKSTLEIDTRTGLIINKIKNSTNYSYSNDSELILFTNKKGNPSIFHRKNKKISVFNDWENCFWLIKNEFK